MSALSALLVIIALVVVATVAGLWWRALNGTASKRVSERIVTASDLDTADAFGSSATIVQFSTEFCAKCPGTRRLLRELASRQDGVAVIDVDLTHRADLADAFDVRQTPTILLLDAQGVLTSRINGAPTRAVVTQELQTVLGTERTKSHVSTD